MVSNNQQRFRLGAKKRPFDNKELAYTHHYQASDVDLTQRYSLMQWTVQPDDQDGQGACVAHATRKGLELLANMITGSYVDLNRQALYNWTRMAEGTPLTDDSGVAPQDLCDVILRKGGAPKDSLWPYSLQNMTQTPPASLDADCPNQNYMASHQGIYTGSNQNFRAGIASALKNKLPVILATAWDDNWFTPQPNGVLPPPQAAPNQEEGGHELLIVTYIPPPLDALILENSWTTGWYNLSNPQDPELKPGFCIYPLSFIDRGYCFDLRVLSPNPALKPPTPTPTPAPQPTPTPQTTVQQQVADVCLKTSDQYKTAGDNDAWYGASSAGQCVLQFLTPTATKDECLDKIAWAYWYYAAQPAPGPARAIGVAGAYYAVLDENISTGMTAARNGELVPHPQHS